jgi:catechol 2,3-dioxygenase-like lactoylglutathione lyase family enzyme
MRLYGCCDNSSIDSGKKVRRMKYSCTFAVLVALGSVCLWSQTAPTRPKITGISHLAVYSTDTAAAEHFYAGQMGFAKLADPENPQGTRYALSSTQWVEVLPLPARAGINRLDHIAFTIESAEGMRAYLAAKSWKVPAAVEKGSDGSRWFTVADPEGNRVEFFESSKAPVAAPHAIGRHIIHVGMMVHSREVEDTFYRAILGFRPYWYGGAEEGRIDWVSQQTPESRDWLEYMMVGPGEGIPATMTAQRLGVLNHLSVGEVSVQTAFERLTAESRFPPHHDPAPKLGHDGKYQLNLYDPDGTRLELMNFKASQTPCCSVKTAPDPEE